MVTVIRFQSEENKLDPDPYIDLANAVIAQAIEDVQCKAEDWQDAKYWLLTDGFDWMVMLEWNVLEAEWCEWVKMGCPQKLNFQTKLSTN